MSLTSSRSIRAAPLGLCALLFLLAAPLAAQDDAPLFRDFRAELLLAIELNDLEETRRVLDEGAAGEINEGNPSPLTTAVALDNLNMVALLLRSGGDPNLVEDDPLANAIRVDSIDMVRLLLRIGTRLPESGLDDLLQTTLRGRNALAIYRELLDRGADLGLAFAVAVENRKLEAALLCIERGADVTMLGELDLMDIVPPERRQEILGLSVRDDNREAALSYFLSAAAADGDRERIDLVLENGGAVKLEHLERAERQRRDDTVLYLMERRGDELSALITQAEGEGKEDLATFLRTIRAQRISSVLMPVVVAAASTFVLVILFVFLRKSLLRSPRRLHQAVLRGDLAAVEKLLDAGADPNAKVDGKGALHIATERGDLKVARALLRHDARLTQQAAAAEGATPLHLAAAAGNVPLAELFLRIGVPTDVRAGNGLTPLYAAAGGGRDEMIQLLLERGADLHILVNQQTLLFTAVSEGNREAARRLLEIGVDPNADRGRTALHTAAALGELDLVRLLVRYGASVDAVDPDGHTPLELARSHKRTEVVLFLQEASSGRAPAPAPAPPEAVSPAAVSPESLVTQPIAPIQPASPEQLTLPPPEPPAAPPVLPPIESLVIPHPEPLGTKADAPKKTDEPSFDIEDEEP